MQSTLATCKYCGHSFTGNYCNNCGEKVYTDHDKSFFLLIEEGIHFVTHFDGTFFTTIKYIFTKPGKLSEDYCYGIRKSLFKPLSLFFLLIIIYLLFPVFEGLNMRLYYHVNHFVYGDYAMKKAVFVIRQHHWTDQQLTDAFHVESVKVSKFLLMILLPFTAFFFWACTYRKRGFFFDQMVFATEINSVFLFWGFMLMPVLLRLFEALYKLVAGDIFSITDFAIGIIIYVAVLIYVVFAARRFYKLRLGAAIGLALLFYLAHFIIVQIIYKFLLFFITINLLH